MGNAQPSSKANSCVRCGLPLKSFTKGDWLTRGMHRSCWRLDKGDQIHIEFLIELEKMRADDERRKIKAIGSRH